jgi:hypothetical protein
VADRIVEFSEDGDRRVKRIEDPPKVYPEQAELPTEADEREARQTPARKVAAACAMAVAGANYEEIARVLNYQNASSARVAVETAFAATAAPSDYKAARALAQARLEGLMKSLAPRALHEYVIKDEDGKKTKVYNEDHLAYARMFLSVVDRHIKLQGLDAPTVVTMVTPDQEEFNRVVAELSRRALIDESPEGDILMLEQAPDGMTWQESDGDAH